MAVLINEQYHTDLWMNFYEVTLSAKGLPKKAKGPGNKDVSSQEAGLPRLK